MNNIDDIEDMEDEALMRKLRDSVKLKSFGEIFAEFQTKEAASAKEVFRASKGTAVAGGGYGRPYRNKQLFVSVTAIIMCIVLLLSLIGTFLYFQGDRTITLPPEVENNLIMTAIGYEELHRQGIFIPNLDNLTDRIVRRGDDRDTDVTKLFAIDGNFGDSWVTIRIVVYADFRPRDEAYFEGGRLVEVHEREVRINSSTNEGRYSYRMLFEVDNIRYYITLTTQTGGGYMPLLDELLRERMHGSPNPPNPPVGDIDLTEITLEKLKAADVFVLNLGAIDDITAGRAYDRESGRTLFFVVDGYFCGYPVNIRIVAHGEDIEVIDNYEKFLGTNTPTEEIEHSNNVRHDPDNGIYRIAFIYDWEIFHFVELTTPVRGMYLPLLHAILQ